MPRAASPPPDPTVQADRLSLPEAGSPRRSQFLEIRPFSLRSESTPHPAPERTLFFSKSRCERLEGLRRRIERIERQGAEDWSRPAGGALQAGGSRAFFPAGPGCNGAPAAWTLGAPEIDSLLGPRGLEPCGLHEIKSVLAGAGGQAAALAFALRLALRLAQSRLSAPAEGFKLMWCHTAHRGSEAGHLYGPGLLSLGLDPRALLLIETRRDAETLWALEEGLKSEAVALVMGRLGTAELTPARRLALAAEGHRTPCLLLTQSQTPPIAATASRWRAGPAPSAPHPFDPKAPGAVRFSLTLERCRNRPLLADPTPLDLEWCHETRRFRLASRLAHRADAPAHTLRRAR